MGEVLSVHRVCDKCDKAFGLDEVVADRTRYTKLTYDMHWVRNVSTETPIDASKAGHLLLCNTCTQSLIDWWQNEEIKVP